MCARMLIVLAIGILDAPAVSTLRRRRIEREARAPARSPYIRPAMADASSPGHGRGSSGRESRPGARPPRELRAAGAHRRLARRSRRAGDHSRELLCAEERARAAALPRRARRRAMGARARQRCERCSGAISSATRARCASTAARTASPRSHEPGGPPPLLQHLALRARSALYAFSARSRGRGRRRARRRPRDELAIAARTLGAAAAGASRRSSRGTARRSSCANGLATRRR